jgi:hypothetical protein
MIAERGYTLKKAFNLDETDLFWKHMATCIFISFKEKIIPGFNTACYC